MEKQVSKNSLIFKLIYKLLIGLGALLLAFSFVYSDTGNSYHEYLLITKGTTTTGFITNAFEDVGDDAEGGTHFNYSYAYNFTADNGRKFNSGGNSYGRLPDELSDLSDPYPTDVVYLKNNPEINKLKNTLCDSVVELLWRRVGFGIGLLLLLSSIGFYLIKDAIKNYLTERKELTAQEAKEPSEADKKKWNALAEKIRVKNDSPPPGWPE